jgi:hypothetical protein
VRKRLEVYLVLFKCLDEFGETELLQPCCKIKQVSPRLDGENPIPQPTVGIEPEMIRPVATSRETILKHMADGIQLSDAVPSV